MKRVLTFIYTALILFHGQAAPGQDPDSAKAERAIRSPAPWIEVEVEVEVEEEVYTHAPAQNGAGPMWCAGSTSLVRTGEKVFATGLETLEAEQPLNNCRWILYERTQEGWKARHRNEGRTREPAPMACFSRSGEVIVSGNPTLGTGPEPHGGPTRPELLFFQSVTDDPVRVEPQWKGSPRFREHSYRSLAADGDSRELILFQNIDYGHAEWAFRDGAGSWRAQGRLDWPWGADYPEPKPVRLCYPNVAIRNRAVHFFGVEDVTEPIPAWQAHKKETTGREWDYVFRRLYYTWTSNITEKPFHEWIEIANVEPTSGHLWPCDLWLSGDGSVHLLWSETAIDERLRPKFFPDARQARRLHHTVLRDGVKVSSHVLFESTEDHPGLHAARARFHEFEGEPWVVAHVQGQDRDGRSVSENRLFRPGPEGERASEQIIPFRKPFTQFFTATPRAGCEPSPWLDMLGTQEGHSQVISYARIRLKAP